jgi:hypothetical protein
MGLFTFRWILSLASILGGLALVDMAFKKGAFGPGLKKRLEAFRGENWGQKSDLIKAVEGIREELNKVAENVSANTERLNSLRVQIQQPAPQQPQHEPQQVPVGRGEE